MYGKSIRLRKTRNIDFYLPFIFHLSSIFIFHSKSNQVPSKAGFYCVFEDHINHLQLRDLVYLFNKEAANCKTKNHYAVFWYHYTEEIQYYTAIFF